MTHGYRYGVLPADEIAGLTGREAMQAMVDGRFPQPPIAETMSFALVEVGDGFAAFEGEPGPHLLNPMGGVHGGWALTLIDSATGCAGWTTLPAGAGWTTVETKGNLARPLTTETGRVRAEARVVSAGRRIISVECTIRTGDGKVVAHGTSTLMVLPG
jgi:uncharacterized protein (TIGR00369 family)